MNASSPIIVIEPHADDAFLSLGGHIEEWTKAKRDVLIITVFSGTRKRSADAAAYAAAAGARWEGWGYVEGEPLPGTLPPLPGTSQVILPLALTHPEHRTVREALERPGVWYYLDQPYAITQKNGPLITDLLRGKSVVSYRKPGVRKYRHCPLFKDQAKFYHYNPPEKLIQTCELIVENPE